MSTPPQGLPGHPETAASPLLSDVIFLRNLLVFALWQVFEVAQGGIVYLDH